MASEYIRGVNPFEEYLIHTLLEGIDLTVEEDVDEVFSSMVYLLELILGTDEHNHLFSFDIINDDEKYLVFGNNLITSLWLIGIFPDNVEKVILDNSFTYDGMIYSYDNDEDEFIISKLLN